MEKTATLNLKVNPDVKDRAEAVLSKLGIPMSTAITMYLNQISLTGSIPFAITLPKVPDTINADQMTTEELHAKLGKGYEDVKAGRTQNAADAFAKFRENYRWKNPIADAILTLNELPERCPVMDAEPEHSRGIRRMLVDNYSVFYIIEGTRVIITDVLYSASDIEQRLKY